MRISDWSSDVCSSDLDSECPQVPPMTVDRPASSTAAMSQDSVGLLARHGELMDSQALIAFFQFGSDRSFRRSAAKAALPVAVFRVPGRSGWFARKIGRASCRE